IMTGFPNILFSGVSHAPFPYVSLPKRHEPVLLQAGFRPGNQGQVPKQAIAEDVTNLAVAVREPHPAVLDPDDHHDLGRITFDPGNNVERFQGRRHAVSSSQGRVRRQSWPSTCGPTLWMGR